MNRLPTRSFALVLAPLLLVPLFLALAGSAASEPAPKRVPPKDLDQLGAALDALSRRLDALMEQAKTDPAMAWVAEYAAYKEDDFANPKRKWKAKEILKIMADPEHSYEAREAAMKAMTSRNARENDPDLKASKGNAKPRNAFCMQYVVELLKADNPQTRHLAQQLLEDLNGRPNDPAILAYNPRESGKREQDQAMKAWIKFLRR